MPTRTELTELGLRLAPRISSLRVLIGSSLVEMGVTMAGIQLGGIRIFTTRAEFEQAVRQAVESRGGTYTPSPAGGGAPLSSRGCGRRRCTPRRAVCPAGWRA